MRISIRCEECGFRHRLERDVTDGRPIWVVCHSCETPLRAEVPPRPGFGRRPPISEAVTSVPIPAMWGGLFDRREAEPAS